MEVEIDPLMVLEQFMQVNEQDDTAPEAMDEEMFEISDLEQSNSTVLEPRKQEKNTVAEDDEQVNSTTEDNPPINDFFPLSTPVFDIENIIDRNECSKNTDVTVINDNLNEVSTNHNEKPPGPPVLGNQIQNPQTMKKKIPLKKKVTTITIARKKPRLSRTEQYLLNVQHLASPTNAETTYRSQLYPQIDTVLSKKLDCTVCGTHIGCRPNMKVSCVIHPLLKVLVCNTCKNNYTARDWTVSNKKESNCRWCGKPSSPNVSLLECYKCPFTFCQLCLSQNFAKAKLSNKPLNSEWECLVCLMTPLYFQRALAWALESYIFNLNKSKMKGPSTLNDLSTCCKSNQVNQVSTIGDCLLVKQSNGTLMAVINKRPTSTEPNHTNEVVPPVRIHKIKSTYMVQKCPPKPVNVDVTKSHISTLFKNIEEVKKKIALRFGTTVKTSNDFKSMIFDTKFLVQSISREANDCITALDKLAMESLSSNGPTRVKMIESPVVKPQVNIPTVLNPPILISPILNPPVLVLTPPVKHNPVQTLNMADTSLTRIHNVPSFEVPKDNSNKTISLNNSVSLSLKESVYSELFKKYNIKPCRVVLERCQVIDEMESEKDSLLMSLLENQTLEIQDSEVNLFVPQVELIETNPTSQFNSLISNTDEDYIVIDD